jgi:hypothetical protein
MTLPEPAYTLGFVESVLYRPAMYTPTGTFEAAFCFLAGFYDGMTAHTREKRAQARAAQDWYGFLEWMQPHVAHAANASWQELYRAIRQNTSDEAHAFQFVIRQYRTYREDYTATHTATETVFW